MQVKQQYYDIVQKTFKNADAFFTEVENVANSLGIKADWLNDVMYIETAKSFSPSERNKLSTATGLIQFMEATAKGLGTSTAQLARMSNIQQLAYVKKYFQNQIASFGKPNDGFETYLLVFYPVWRGKPMTATMNLATSKPNIDIDRYFGNKDGIVSKGEFFAFYNSKIGAGNFVYFLEKKRLPC